MTAHAMGLEWRNGEVTTHILFMRDRLKVARVNASGSTADVIQFESFFDAADIHLIKDIMDTKPFSREEETAVTFDFGSSPEPTIIENNNPASKTMRKLR